MKRLVFKKGLVAPSIAAKITDPNEDILFFYKTPIGFKTYCGFPITTNVFLRAVMNRLMPIGPKEVKLGGKVIYYLTGSSNLTINVSAKYGACTFVSRASEVYTSQTAIEYTAPLVMPSEGYDTINFAGFKLDVTLLSGVTITPSIVYPINGQSNVDNDTIIRSSAFSSSIDGDYHKTSTWQIATDKDFTNIIFNNYIKGSVTNPLTELSLNYLNNSSFKEMELLNDTWYYVRVKHNSSNYSKPVCFKTAKTPNVIQEVGYINNPDPVANGVFGHKVCMSNNGLVCVVAACTTGINGLIYIYRRSANNFAWVLDKKIEIPGIVGNVFSFTDITLNYTGSVIVISNSAINKVCIIDRQDNLEYTVSDIPNPSGLSGVNFGYSVGVSDYGSIILISALNIAASHPTGIGTVYQYSYVNRVLNLIGEVPNPNGVYNDFFGYRIAMDELGTNVFISAPTRDSLDGLIGGGEVFQYTITGETILASYVGNLPRPPVVDNIYDVGFGSSMAKDASVLGVAIAGSNIAKTTGETLAGRFRNRVHIYSGTTFSSLSLTKTIDDGYPVENSRDKFKYAFGLQLSFLNNFKLLAISDSRPTNDNAVSIYKNYQSTGWGLVNKLYPSNDLVLNTSSYRFNISISGARASYDLIVGDGAKTTNVSSDGSIYHYN